MRSLHLTLLIFGQVLLASFILYSAVTSASPLNQQTISNQAAAAPKQIVEQAHKQEVKLLAPVVQQQHQENAKSEKVGSESISARSLKEPTIAEPKAEKKEQVVPKHAPVAPKEPSVPQPEAKLEAKSIVDEVIHKQQHQVSSGHKQVVADPSGLPTVQVAQHQAIVQPRSHQVAPVVPEVQTVHKPVPQEAAPVVPEVSKPIEHEPVVRPVQVQQSARLRNLPDMESFKAEQAKVVVPEAKSAQVISNEIQPSKVETPIQKQEVAKEADVEARREKILAEKAYREMVGKSQVLSEQQIAPLVMSQQQVPVADVKLPVAAEVQQAPVEVAQAPVVAQDKVPESVVGVVEPVKKVEPVSASVLLTVQSPEPKITVVSKVSDYHQLEQQHQQQAPMAVQQPQQVVTSSVVTKIQESPAPVAEVSQVAEVRAPVSSPIVNGGLGPLHLLATTLCSYQPDKPVADETLNSLYSQRASVRKSLFDFMSLKFTNLEKFSSRLNAGLEIMPRKTTDPGVVPSHGWPVVGKCTAHDLKLMAEAAWCETPAVPTPTSTEALDKEDPKITSNHHHRFQAARALAEEQQQQQDQSAVISKILHVSEIKDSPIVESSIANLNLTQQQLADIQAQATSTRVCRRNALKLTKALFNHLAEEQKSVSDSWPQLYSQMAGDDCARKRMIDIVNALSGFRTDSTSIRRDNVEFAFAMDDLRSKVLDSEVNVPLTFDKQFIEVEQFLQQSVKLMLANIDPEKAKLTSMRYRSLMPGPLSADDQCIELHQRLLAKNYPTDCNPTQFGQLPDVLRMAASSLELWSIENDLSKRSGKYQEYPSASSQTVRQDVNQCIANLVAS